MTEDELNKLDSEKNTSLQPSKVMFGALVVFYVASTIFVILISRMGGTVSILGNELSITAFSGVLTSFGNICLIFMVVYFKRLGFWTSFILSMLQFPAIIVGIFVQKIMAILPGLFTNLVTVLAIVFIYQRNKRIEKYQQSELELLRNQHKATRRLFRQTATALVNAIDAKDTYSRGHSLRVAEYSMRIAEAYGMDEEECRKVYYAGLLHDVGKIGIPIEIINKKGKLTEEEFDVIKGHSKMGNQILSSISEYPFLCVGAHYHHERYDGKGYPGECGKDAIPEIARIISVADSYDAMTSNRSYRKALPQTIVRKEIENGKGTQFDPTFADIMLQLIDADVDYDMREKDSDGFDEDNE